MFLLFSVGNDFAIQGMHVNLSSDILIACVTIQITEDVIKEVNETITLYLDTGDENVMFSNDTVTINLISNDGESYTFSI